jgi:hypothetical protein
MGGGHLQIKVAPTSGASVRGVALKLTRTAGDATISGTNKATATQFNTNIDYAFSHSATYDIGQGHPLAKPDQAGELTAFPASTFSLCSGYLDQSGGKAGVVVDSFFDVFYDLTINSTITIELDSLRGGIVGDTLGTVTVSSPASLNAPPLGYTLTTSSTAGGDVTTPGEGAFGPYTGSVAIVATPDLHYAFVNWTGTGATAGKIANVNAASTTITMDNNYTAIANFVFVPETVSPAPAVPTGPAIGYVGTGVSFTTTGGSASNWGDPVEYGFDWGDTTAVTWGSATQSHSYAAVGNYTVKVRARCATHTGVMSDWSGNSTAISIKPACWGYSCFANGDGNGDGVITFADLNPVINAWPPKAYNPCADFNKDGVITFADLNVIINHWPPKPGC